MQINYGLSFNLIDVNESVKVVIKAFVGTPVYPIFCDHSCKFSIRVVETWKRSRTKVVDVAAVGIFKLRLDSIIFGTHCLSVNVLRIIPVSLVSAGWKFAQM